MSRIASTSTNADRLTGLPNTYGSDRLLRFLTYLWDVAAPYTFTGLVDIDEARHDHERMMDLFEARDLDGIVEMMTRHRGLAVEAVARWEARSRP